MTTLAAILFWLCAAPDRLHPPRLPAGCCALLVAAAGANRTDGLQTRRSTPTSCPRVSLIIAAYDEEEVIAAKVANALALDYPRERLEMIVASDGSADATAERARAAGADLVLELPPRRQGRRPERRRRAGRPARSSPSPTPTASGRRTRCATWSPPSPTRRRLRLRPGPLPRPRRRQPRGRLLALRDGGARDGVRAGRGHRRQRRDLRGPPRRLRPARPVRQPRPQLPLRASPSAASAPSTRPAPAPRRRWCLDLVRRRAGPVARRERPRPHPRAPLCLQRVRGAARL